MKSKYVEESAKDPGRKKKCLHNRAAEREKKSFLFLVLFFVCIHEKVTESLPRLWEK